MSTPYATQPLVLGGREFQSRLFVGTGKFSSNESMRDALDASGTEMVTVALRRADLSGTKDPYANILEFIDPDKYLLLPNTSGAMNADEAVRLLDARHQIEIIIEQATVPVVVDAGLGVPSHAAAALELGADAVLVNTAIAIASNPSAMGHAFKQAVHAGRLAYELGLSEERQFAEATSPLTGFLYKDEAS